jgi:hypothetical protein
MGTDRSISGGALRRPLPRRRTRESGTATSSQRVPDLLDARSDFPAPALHAGAHDAYLGIVSKFEPRKPRPSSAPHVGLLRRPATWRVPPPRRAGRAVGPDLHRGPVPVRHPDLSGRPHRPEQAEGEHPDRDRRLPCWLAPTRQWSSSSSRPLTCAASTSGAACPGRPQPTSSPVNPRRAAPRTARGETPTPGLGRPADGNVDGATDGARSLVCYPRPYLIERG